MKSALWFVIGVFTGFAAAHQVARTPAGARFFDDLTARVTEFTGSVVDGYRSREAELRAAAAEAQTAYDDVQNRGR